MLLLNWQKYVKEARDMVKQKAGAENVPFKFETVVNKIITSYIHMRGRETSRTHNNNIQWVCHTCTSGTRDRLADIGACKTIKKSNNS